jgi:LysR family transcriptional regulator, regulator for genes of the gallate degradation pathway
MESRPIPPLSIKQMRAIVAVANTQGFAAAADDLGSSQSSLSRAVREAERSLGAALFRRGWNGAEPTTEGEIAVQCCARAISAICDQNARLAAEAAARPNLLLYLTWAHLDVIAAVVAGGGATAASRLLRTSQPHVSRTLATLATACGQDLFRREPTRLAPLPAANRLVALRERLLAEILPLPAMLRKLAASVGGRVAVGMTPFSEQDLVARAFGALLRLHPHIRLSAVTGSYTMLVEAMRRDELDFVIGVLRDPPRSEDLREVPLYDERIMVVARRDHPCARGLLNVADLARQNWIVAPHGTPIRNYFEELFLRSGAVPPVQTCEIVNFSLAEETILQSDSLALLLYSDRKASALRHELALVAADLPKNRRKVGLTMLTGKTFTPAEQAFLDWLKANHPDAAEVP